MRPHEISNIEESSTRGLAGGARRFKKSEKSSKNIPWSFNVPQRKCFQSRTKRNNSNHSHTSSNYVNTCTKSTCKLMFGFSRQIICNFVSILLPRSTSHTDFGMDGFSLLRLKTNFVGPTSSPEIIMPLPRANTLFTIVTTNIY